jgi:predicted alpha/beta superfamily hydrolase
MNRFAYSTVFALLLVAHPCPLHAQDVTMRLGIVDTVRSDRLHETRRLIVHLPGGYDASNERYPVLYLLDGTRESVLETIAAMNKLRADGFAPEMLVVAIENVNRDRDMMPLSTKAYPVSNPGAERFLGFIADDLIPHIDRTYRTTEKRILVGKSLSGLFALYALLTRPAVFDSYVGRSAGWLGDMNDYFSALTDAAFQRADQYQGKVIFMSMSLMDTNDPDQIIHRQMLAFSQRVAVQLGERVRYKYEIYGAHPHVPYPSLYDGLRFVFETSASR